ncbi:MAG: hypothetical protein HF308_06050 [Ignavibacteria bacterium]|jgi:hypothetical protein|nr:hypothetical protein [Ignavibacteria bacterium]MCU7520538.1 hypothetical protein [Ignavibacteria bacterium]MCU7524014.1 hypothetical protein [Ignavibacteria bacterium]
MNKKRNFQDDQHNQQKNMRKRNKMEQQEQNKVKYPENDPHVRDMDDGNGDILGGKI